MIAVRPASPREPGALRLLEQSHALMRAMFPAESNHFLGIEALCAPDIRFFAAEEAGTIRATGALALREGYGEVKSMFTDPAARGRGLAGRILARIEAEARALGLPLLRLETGAGLDAAHRLYARHGFRLRGPFGAYPDDPLSLFMEKRL